MLPTPLRKDSSCLIPQSKFDYLSVVGSLLHIANCFRCDISYSIKDKNDKLIEGGSDNIKKQKDVWTFARKMNSDIPNWYLIKTE